MTQTRPEPRGDRAEAMAADGQRRSGQRVKHAVRSLGLALVVLVGLALATLIFAPLLVIVSVPTTFSCRAFIDASGEAKLAYPEGRVLSYDSKEGVRHLIEMSSPQLPGFTKYFAIAADDREAFRWFDQHLRAMGWSALNPEAELQVSQSEGDTVRAGAELISLVRFDPSRVPPGVTTRPAEGQALLRYSYLIQDSSAIPACR